MVIVLSIFKNNHYMLFFFTFKPKQLPKTGARFYCIDHAQEKETSQIMKPRILA